MLRDTKKSSLEQTLAGRVKLMPSNKTEKVERGIKTSTPDKLFARLPVLLAKIKAGYNSYKLKNQIRQILYLLYRHNKIIKKFNQVIITIRVVIKDKKLVIVTEIQHFYSDLPKNIGNNLKHGIDCIIKHNEFLAEQMIENEIS